MAVADLAGTDFADDALVAERHAATVALAHHGCEFIEWSQCRADGGSLADSDWYRPTWRDLAWADLDAANSAVDEGSLARLEITRSRLTGIVWSGSTLTDVSFTDCVLDLAALRDCTLLRVTFTGCRMVGIDLSMAKFSDVRFDGCDLSEAQFHQARVVTRTRVEGCELAGARGLAQLRGLVVQPVDLIAFTAQLAAELGIIVDA